MAQAAPSAPATSSPTSQASANPAAAKTALNGKTPPPQAAPTPAEIRKLKLKLDGKEVEMPESEVIAMAQKASMSDKRFMEGAALKKQAEDIMAFAKTNPVEFFKKTGLDFRQISENYLVEELKREQMSPEQRKAAENETKLKEYEADKKKTADQAKKREIAELQKKHADNYNQLFVEALNKSGLPKTPYTIKRMAELQLVKLKLKLELNADQLAKVVREDYINEQKMLFGSTEGEQLLEMLGPELIKKLSKAQIAKLKSKGAKTISGDQNKPRKSDDGSTNGMSAWRAYQMKNRGRL